MKLAQKFAIVSGSGAFILISYSAFFNAMNPEDSMKAMFTGGMPVLNSMKFLEIAFWAFLGAFVAGIIGRMIGDIMDNPMGMKPEEIQKTRRELAEEKVLKALEQAEAEGAIKLEDIDYQQPTPAPIE
ncbi:MAG: hypothetical protein K2X66_18965 [Cyanobacteria bacterium]|nr:hypothetical protein [Cyanobacteriota bacterium]